MKYVPYFGALLVVLFKSLSIYFAISYGNENEIYSALSESAIFAIFFSLLSGLYYYVCKMMIFERQIELEKQREVTARAIAKIPFNKDV